MCHISHGEAESSGNKESGDGNEGDKHQSVLHIDDICMGEVLYLNDPHDRHCQCVPKVPAETLIHLIERAQYLIDSHM